VPDFIIRTMPDDLHRKLKIEAATLGTTMKDLIIKILTDYFKKKK
jgi:plasmid stability protein